MNLYQQNACQFNSTTCSSNKKWNNDKCQWSVKRIVHAKIIIARILVHHSKSLKRIADKSTIVSDEIKSVTTSASTNVTNTVSTNVLRILAKKCHDYCVNEFWW